MTYNLISNIEYLLSINNLTHSDFANMIGDTGGAAISNWINKKTKPPLLKVIAISKEFDISLDKLVYSDLSHRASVLDIPPIEHAEDKKNEVKREVIDKDLIIGLLQDRVKHLEEGLPNMLKEVMAVPAEQIGHIYDALYGAEIIEGVAKRKQSISSNKPKNSNDS